MPADQCPNLTTLSISMSQLSPIIMSEIPDLIILIYNGCVLGDPEWTGAMPITSHHSHISNIQYTTFYFIVCCAHTHSLVLLLLG